MAKKYIKLYLDLLDALEPLGDAERGRLFTALLEYGRTGAAPELCGNERFLFPMIRAQLDRDGESYAAQCQANLENGKLGGAPSGNNNRNKRNQPKQPKSSQDKDKDKDKDKDEECYPPNPLSGGTDFGSELQSAFDSWLAYKTEKRQPYKPTGLQSLKAEIKSNAEKHGEGAVAALIRKCMASNWQGIIFDRLDTQKPTDAPVDRKKAATDQERTAVEELRRMMREG